MSAIQNRKLEKAAAALAAGDLGVAERLCGEVVQRAPRHPRALHLAALVHHRRGDFARALEMLRRALEVDPRNAQLHQELGALELELSDPAQAESALRRAVDLGARDASTQCWLGIALSSQGKDRDAVEAFRKAAEAEPRNVGIHLNLAKALIKLGSWDEAVAAGRRALDVVPTDPDACYGLAEAWLVGGHPDKAEDVYRHAIARNPGLADFHADLGNLLLDQFRWQEAADAYREAIRLKPAFPETQNNLGTVLRGLGRLEDSVASIRGALALRPDFALAHENLAYTLCQLGRDSEADAAYRRAIALEPNNASFRFGFGNALKLRHRWDEALQQLTDALKIDPGHVDAHLSIGVTRLFRWEFELAWPELEWRKGTREFRQGGFRKAHADWESFERLPGWMGPGAAGVRQVAVWAEQGIGDQVLFSTLIPELEGTGVPFVYEVDRRLLPAYARAYPRLVFVPNDSPPDEALQRASHVILAGSLPGLYRRGRGDFARQPARTLVASPERRAHYRRQLDDVRSKGIKVALSWRSSRKDWWLGSKNARLDSFLPLLETAGVQFVDVQYGDTEEERAEVEKLARTRITRFKDVDHLTDLDEVLAILDACDLVITTSSATAHFAGALGKKTWVLFPADQPPFHYWAHHGTYRSLWYPSVEIVTAANLLEWNGLAEHVAHKLARERAARDGDTAAGPPGQ